MATLETTLTTLAHTLYEADEAVFEEWITSYLMQPHLRNNTTDLMLAIYRDHQQKEAYDCEFAAITANIGTMSWEDNEL